MRSSLKPARPLFEDGKRTPVIEHALQFCIERSSAGTWRRKPS